MSLLQRYNNGEHAQVWNQITKLTENEAIDLGLSTEIHSIVEQAMQIVKENIKIIYGFLLSNGYIFGYSWADAMVNKEKERIFLHKTRARNEPQFNFGEESEWEPEILDWINEQPLVISDPVSNVDELIQELEKDFGPLPLSIKYWHKIVGGVNFVGSPPVNWYSNISIRHYGSLLDPLFVFPISNNLLERVKVLGYLPISPDENEKYYFSGGQWKHLNFTQTNSIDGRVLGDWLNLEFIEYLRLAISWGGLPGMGRISNRPDIMNNISSLLLEF